MHVTTTTSVTETCNPYFELWRRIHEPDPYYAQGSLWSHLNRDAEPLSEEVLSWMDEHHRLWYERDRGRNSSVVYEVARGSFRERLIDHFSFAVPSPEALDLIAKNAPILEIGAGTGYWAWCLRQMGVDVVATDLFPPQTHPVTLEKDANCNHWFAVYWTDIERLDAVKAVLQHPNRSLLLVWPYMDKMAERALRAYQGDTIIYVGEGDGGATTKDKIPQMLSKWECVETQIIPQWPGVHD